MEVSTFECPSRKALGELRSAISPDGSSIPTGGGTAIVEWAAAPHAYGAGRLLVLHVGDRRRTLDALDQLLGPQFAGGISSHTGS